MVFLLCIVALDARIDDLVAGVAIDECSEQVFELVGVGKVFLRRAPW